MALSLINLSGRFFLGSSRVVCNSSFQSLVCPGMCSSYPKRDENAEISTMYALSISLVSDIHIIKNSNEMKFLNFLYSAATVTKNYWKFMFVFTIFSTYGIYSMFQVRCQPTVDLVWSGYTLKGMFLCSTRICF